VILQPTHYILETGRCQFDIPTVKDDSEMFTTRKRRKKSNDGSERDGKKRKTNE
jgi:hypothetical protein